SVPAAQRPTHPDRLCDGRHRAHLSFHHRCARQLPVDARSGPGDRGLLQSLVLARARPPIRRQPFLGILLHRGSGRRLRGGRPAAPAPPLTAIVILASLVTVIPAAVFPTGLFWVRYLALGIAVLLSLLHWLISRPRARAATPDLRRSSQVTLAVTGATALLLF